MTHVVTHIARIVRWGRVLARHGALRGIEKSATAPRSLKRMARLARLGSFAPQQPDYVTAFQQVGPAAVKLGQALATRPDIVGEKTATELLQLQDALEPLPVEVIHSEIESAFGQPLSALYSEFDPQPVGSASIAQVHRAVTTEGREVAVKVRRPNVVQQFARDIESYEWIAAHLEALGGEATRLRPRLVIANFKRWTRRELDFRREAAAASELAETMAHEDSYYVPAIDWERTNGRVLTSDWVEGLKISDRTALLEAGHDLPKIARSIVCIFLHQAISGGFFHADMHHGNLFIRRDGTIAAVDFGIMGRIDHRARRWLAEILYGLTTGDYRRVAEIHFEAQYVPAHHNVDDFAMALRAVGEPMRGRPVNEISVGQMLDGLFAITRDFDMEVQPHLLLLQKTMVMVEGIAIALDPKINMWETSAPYVKSWLRDEMGPEALLADRLIGVGQVAALIPDIVRRLDAQLPRKGGAPPPPSLPDVPLLWDSTGGMFGGSLGSHLLTAIVAAALGAIALWVTL